MKATQLSSQRERERDWDCEGAVSTDIKAKADDGPEEFYSYGVEGEAHLHKCHSSEQVNKGYVAL